MTGDSSKEKKTIGDIMDLYNSSEGKEYKIVIATVSSFRRKGKIGEEAYNIRKSRPLHLYPHNFYRQTNHVTHCGNASTSWCGT